MRAVLDTNVVWGAGRRSFLYGLNAPSVIAARGRSISQRIEDQAKSRKFVYVSSPELIREFELQMPKIVMRELRRAIPRISRDEVRERLLDVAGIPVETRMSDDQLSKSVARGLRNEMRKMCECVYAADVPLVCKDPDDDYVLAVAREGKAQYIVTYDRHLLSLDYKRMVRRHRKLSDTYSEMLMAYNFKVHRDRKQINRRRSAVNRLDTLVRNALKDEPSERLNALTIDHAKEVQRFERLKERRDRESSQQWARLEEWRRNTAGHREYMKSFKQSEAYKLYGHITILPPYEFVKILEAAQASEDEQQVA